MAGGIRVRPPLPGDAPALAALAGELGYPTDAEAMLGRLAAVHPTDAAVIVSTDAGEGHRSEGIGAELLSAAERWARARGSRALVVATRLTRERAHQFYAREGFRVAKTSYFLTKALD